jgi:hypothetical protein
MGATNDSRSNTVVGRPTADATGGGASNRVSPLKELGGATIHANEPGVRGAPGHTVPPLSELGGATTRANESEVPGGAVTPLSELGGATTHANERGLASGDRQA